MSKICSVCGGMYELGKSLRCNNDSFEICYSCSDKFKKLDTNDMAIEEIVTDKTDSRILKHYSLPYEEREKQEASQVKPVNNISNTTYNTMNYSNSASKSSETSSALGTMIKGLSAFVTLLLVCGSFFYYEDLGLVAVGITIASLLSGLLCYGIGEIVTLLTSINSKLK